MPTFNPNDIHPRHFYQLFMGSLVPRPIAWALTQNEDQTLNLAPMSCFSAVNTRPPMVMMSIGEQDGDLKHTTANVLRAKEVVIHIPEFHQLDAVHQSAGHYPKDASEVDALGLETEPSQVIGTPSLKASRVRMECTLHSVHELPSNHVLFLNVERLIIDDSVMENGTISNALFKPIARISGGYYAGLTQPIHLKKYPIRS